MDEQEVNETNEELVKLRERAEKAEKERDFLVSEYERAVKCEKLGFTHAAVHLFNAIVNARCDANADRFTQLMERAEKAESELDKVEHRVSGCCPQSEMLQRKLDEMEAALRRVTSWVQHMDSRTDTDWCYMTKLEEILSNNGLWREEPKGEQ